MLPRAVVNIKGNTVKKLVLAATVLAASTASAFAADLGARPYTKAPIAAPVLTYDWTGFYIGADVGYGWGRSTRPLANAAWGFSVPFNPRPSGGIGGGVV